MLLLGNMVYFEWMRIYAVRHETLNTQLFSYDMILSAADHVTILFAPDSDTINGKTVTSAALAGVSMTEYILYQYIHNMTQYL